MRTLTLVLLLALVSVLLRNRQRHHQDTSAREASVATEISSAYQSGR